MVLARGEKKFSRKAAKNAKNVIKGRYYLRLKNEEPYLCRVACYRFRIEDLRFKNTGNRICILKLDFCCGDC